MSKMKTGRKPSERKSPDLELLLRMCYEHNTTAFMTMVGFSRKEADELLALYSKRRERVEGIGAAFAEAAEAFNNLKAANLNADH